MQFFRVTYKDPKNQAVVDRLIGEVKALNPEFLTQHIKGTTDFTVPDVKMSL